eukprot:9467695-Pyramimonas_sp.AAC.1
MNLRQQRLESCDSSHTSPSQNLTTTIPPNSVRAARGQCMFATLLHPCNEAYVRRDGTNKRHYLVISSEGCSYNNTH